MLVTLAFTACGPQNSRNNSKAGGSSQINALLCSEYLKKKSLKIAMSKCEKSLKQNPANANAHKWIAVLHLRLGQDKLAGRHFQRAVELAPNDSTAHNNYGTYLCRNNQLKKAEVHFLKAVSNPLYRSRHVAYVNAGACMQKAGNMKKAEKYFRAALRTTPFFGPALIRMAYLTYEQDKCISALGFVRRWSKNNHWSSKSLWLAMNVEKKCGNANKYVSHGLLLKSRFPTSVEASKYKQWKHRY